MGYDDVIIAMGEFGNYQRRILLLLCLPLISCGFHTMVGVFLSAQPDFRCLQSPYETLENSTYQSLSNITNNQWKFAKNLSNCQKYDSDLSNPNYANNTKCEVFLYDKTTYELTITTEFNLVCNNSWLRATTDALFLLGMMLGSLIFGGLSDKYGRKKILYLTLFLQAFFGLIITFSPDIISYIIFRLIIGSAVNGTFVISYVIVVEMIVPKRRLIVGIGIQIFFSIGHILITVFSYFITNWRILQIAITLPNFAYLVYWWFIPESTRWLVTSGRLKEAVESLKKASLENGKELSQDKLENMLKNCTIIIDSAELSMKKSSIFHLFTYPNLRKRSLLLFFIWFVINSTYYGLSWNTSSLVGNSYINFAISGIVEIPAHLFVLSTLNICGRKSILSIAIFIAGTSLLLRIFLSNYQNDNIIPWIEIVLTMIGKLAISASFSTVYVFSSEQFPTVNRNFAMGICSTSGMIGGILSSYINYLSVFWNLTPVVIFGSGSIIAGLSVLFLPETLNEKLPESIEDGEEFGKKRNNQESSQQ